MLKNTIEELFLHMKWADAAVWQSVLDFSKKNEDRRLHDLLHHIHLTQHAFGTLWRGEKLGFQSADDFENLAAVSKWGKEGHERLAEYLNSESNLDLAQDMAVPWAKLFERQIGKKPALTNLGETMLQLTHHSSYHRGQVNARLRELGAEPPMVDYIAWLWLGKPNIDWP